MPVDCTIKEVRRYLGMQKAGADDVLDAEIQKTISFLQDRVHPASVYRVFPLTWKDGMPVIAGYLFESHDLARCLKGCAKAVLLAATLGAEADRLIRRAQLRSMSEAALLQAASAALVESYTDALNRQILDEAKQEGLYGRPRYSPGYGDLDLAVQRIVFALLQPEKYAGIVLNQSLLMSPSKSITAIIGLAETEGSCIKFDCEACSRKSACAYYNGE